ncbi:coiled-coil domain-containing protein 173-like [Melanaphis sacchari]|uniref:coiled-coil domain-containing protein 173-like n=1 Tax=Melanaphis sacchari TaxID=742174 RepID=UPI000DC13554|nr:coiled-coil domain-containing protein 173-like [Melanaphis sacchari]
MQIFFIIFISLIMEIVYVGHRNPSNRALLISNKEWKRLGKILTKKMDEEESVEASKRLKEMRRETSKKMVDGWDNTELNKTKKLLEQKRKALSELEAKRQQRDEEMKREALDARNRIIAKAYKQKFEERDAMKTFSRALLHSEVFKERAIQFKFNEAERQKRMQKDLETAQEQNNETERYRKHQANEKQKYNELKRSKAEILLKELKEREDKRNEERIAYRESGKMELQKIAEEIEEAQEMAATEVRVAKEKLQKDLVENLMMITKQDEVRKTEEWEEEMVTTIMAETKKALARARRLKEIEMVEVKQLALEEMRMRSAAWPTKPNGWAESDVQDAIEAQEKRYREKERKKKELANKKIEHIDIGKKLWKEEIHRRRERSEQDFQLEMYRREREKKLLTEFVNLRRRLQMENAKQFREQLDKQCNDKRITLLANRQADIDRHEAFEHQWHREDEEFLEYANNVIEKKKLVGSPVVPLLKTVKDYLEKNNLCMDKDNKVSKKIPKGPIYTSRIIRHI